MIEEFQKEQKEMLQLQQDLLTEGYLKKVQILSIQLEQANPSQKGAVINELHKINVAYEDLDRRLAEWIGIYEAEMKGEQK